MKKKQHPIREKEREARTTERESLVKVKKNLYNNDLIQIWGRYNICRQTEAAASIIVFILICNTCLYEAVYENKEIKQ